MTSVKKRALLWQWRNTENAPAGTDTAVAEKSKGEWGVEMQTPAVAVTAAAVGKYRKDSCGAI